MQDSMSEYKAQKEAFVSDNLGQSLSQINGISIIALTSYLLYISLTRRFRPSIAVDYLATVLPLLLAVTISSSWPTTFNISLLAAAWLVYPRPRHAPGQNGHAPGSEHHSEPGKWLEESDSDEEQSRAPRTQPLPSPNSSHSHHLLLPSAAMNSQNSSPGITPSSSPPATPDGSTGPSQRPWRRRHNPTPSTHTHTAIDILPTPELPGTRRDTSAQKNGSYPTRTKDVDDSNVETPPGGRLPFLSVYRAHMMIMTVHCILAVDFPIFPRSQGKCEDVGMSLMDVGVGSFVFSLGLVSASELVHSTSGPSGTLAEIRRAIWKSLPVLALGAVRVLMVKGSEYPEHVTEYGVHWNFFFTLGVLPVFGIALRPVCHLLGWSQTGIVVAVLQQLALSPYGLDLESWIMSPVRVGLFGLNKEGIVSLPGYLAIYLLGIAIGQHVMRAAAPTKRVESVTESAEERIKRQYEKRRVTLAMELASYALGWWLVLGICRWSGAEVSRRMANSSYVFWVAAYNTSFLLGYLLLEIKLFEIPAPLHAVPPLLEAINRNGLIVFLAANLLTGLVNLSVQTMYASDLVAIVILVGYSVGVSAFAWTIRKRRLKI